MRPVHSSNVADAPIAAPASNSAGVRSRRKHGGMGGMLSAAAREVRDVVRASGGAHRRLRNHLVTIALATAGVDLVCAILAFLLERTAPETAIHSLALRSSAC